MKVIQVNATCGIGSTGKICVEISRILSQNNIENYIFHSGKTNGYPLGIQCSDNKYIKWQALKSKILGNYGLNSKSATRRIIRKLDSACPDIVHLHNIHGHDCNIELLFEYFKKNKIKLMWTFHDCWSFTGYCPHFIMAKCEKWRTKCSQCVQCREYSWFFDKSDMLYEKKKRLFEGLDLTIVTPSKWLADSVKQSFLKDYPVVVINNGIDLNIFKPSESDFLTKHRLKHKRIILGVSSSWDKRKGLDVFVDLAKRLPNDYKIVLVGTNQAIKKALPKNILCINHTQNQEELAQIYTVADVFVNPTREDNYPTVNMEALACGTPVLTFRTGGSSEVLDKSCGCVVDCDDIDALEKEIFRICQEKPYSNEACVNKAQMFDKNERFKEYWNLYERINSTGT